MIISAVEHFTTIKVFPNSTMKPITNSNINSIDELQKSFVNPCNLHLEIAMKKWNYLVNNLPPMSFVYIFDFKQMKVIKSKGLKLLGYPDDAEFSHGEMTEMMHENQRKVLSIQALFLASILSKYHSDLTKSGSIIFTNLRAYKDALNKEWLGCQTTEYFQTDDNYNLIRYISWVHIIGKYNGEPVQTRFYVRNNLDDHPIAKRINKEVANLRLEVFEKLGFNKKQREIIEQMNIAGNTNDKILETLSINSKRSLDYHRRKILEKGREIFPLNDFRSASDVVEYLAEQNII